METGSKEMVGYMKTLTHMKIQLPETLYLKNKNPGQTDFSKTIVISLQLTLLSTIR
jgi:hypothetical protein